jgi:hypothetical protein
MNMDTETCQSQKKGKGERENNGGDKPTLIRIYKNITIEDPVQLL